MKTRRRLIRRFMRETGTRAGSLVFVLLVLLLSWPSTTCGVGTPVLEQGEAYERIYIAILYKASECGTQPEFPIIFADEPSAFGVDACAFAIIRGDCPFTQYPLVCLEAYNVDIPHTGLDLKLPDLEL